MSNPSEASPMRSVVVVPTYNERENLVSVVDKIRQAAPSLDILVVDDNSPDGTGKIADELSQASGNRLFVLHRERKEGLGRAYVAGFGRAIQMGYEVILQMDADLSHDPSYLPAFLELIRDADLVLGSRYLHGIRVVNWDFKRLILSKAATKYVQIVTGMRFSDTTGGFKCWRTTTLEAIGLEKVFSNGYLFQVEMTFRAFRRGRRVAELPIIFYERNLGRSKMRWNIIWEAFWGVLKLRLGA
jgi:dolichol-phosphate mannosyltransferase